MMMMWLNKFPLHLQRKFVVLFACGFINSVAIMTVAANGLYVASMIKFNRKTDCLDHV